MLRDERVVVTTAKSVFSKSVLFELPSKSVVISSHFIDKSPSLLLLLFNDELISEFETTSSDVLVSILGDNSNLEPALLLEFCC